MRFFVLSFLFIITINCKNEPKINTTNLVAFAKVYGYVKYFHPSDEASSINWDQFALYGAEKIQHCRNDEQLVKVLNELFKPIAPSIKFNTSDKEVENNSYEILPLDSSTLTQVFWQHEGLGLGSQHQGESYKSAKVIVENGVSKGSLFDSNPEMDATISKEIKNNLTVSLPIVLDKDYLGTYPRPNHEALKQLKSNLKDYRTDLRKTSARLGNVIIIYNVFQHFYPYHDVVNVDWNQELEKALEKSFTDITQEDHLTTIEQMMSPLKDGHVGVSGGHTINRAYTPPFYWEWIENKLIITNVLADNNNITNLLETRFKLKVGDEVTHINGIAAKEYFKKIESRISAATNGFLKYAAQYKSLLGEEGSTINLTINSMDISLTRSIHISREFPPFMVNEYTNKRIEDGIEYLNFNNISMEEIKELFPRLVKSEAIICDLRGYPNSNHEFIKHLMITNDTTTNWMQVPQIVYPDHQVPTGFRISNWTDEMKPTAPFLGDKKIIFITDGRAISYAESFLSYIEGYNLATIVGEPTAGTNGDINIFSIPGGYHIRWTGKKVIKHDGSQFHGIGIEPDILVRKSIAGIKEGIDEQLEVAIQIAKGKN